MWEGYTDETCARCMRRRFAAVFIGSTVSGRLWETVGDTGAADCGENGAAGAGAVARVGQQCGWEARREGGEIRCRWLK